MWSFVLSDLNGVSLGEIQNADNRRVDIPLDGMVTGGFNIRLDERHADVILTTDCLVWAYETIGKKSDQTPDKRLRALGEIVSAEEVTDENNSGTVEVTFADGMFRLLHRLVGKSATGYSNGTVGAQVDRGAIAQAMIDRVQAAVGSNPDAGGDAGIRVGAIGASSQTYIGPVFFAKVGEQIVTLSAALAGFDFDLTPKANGSAANGFWTFNTYAVKGTRREDVIFEFGTGKRNVKGYKRAMLRDNLMNDGYILPPSFPDTTEAVGRELDQPSIDARGRYEDAIASDIVASNLRQSLLQTHLRVRRYPRQTITFEPHRNNAPQFGTAFDVGDVVRFRARRGSKVRIDAMFRVYGVTFNISPTGDATPAITVTPSS